MLQIKNLHVYTFHLNFKYLAGRNAYTQRISNCDQIVYVTVMMYVYSWIHS